MNTIALQKKIDALEKFVKSGSRMLLEFEVTIAKWEKEHGLGRPYKSVGAYMRHIEKSRR